MKMDSSHKWEMLLCYARIYCKWKGFQKLINLSSLSVKCFCHSNGLCILIYLCLMCRWWTPPKKPSWHPGEVTCFEDRGYRECLPTQTFYLWVMTYPAGFLIKDRHPCNSSSTSWRLLIHKQLYLLSSHLPHLSLFSYPAWSP